MTTYSKREVRILIDGTDRTGACILSKSKIEDVITSQVNSATFVLYRHIDDADFGLDEAQEVLVVNPADPSERYFAGIVRQITDWEEGDYFFYELDVVDFSWWLEHPQALVDGSYASQTDAAIIADFMANTNPDIDATTYVDNVGGITNIEFDNVTAWAALEELAKRVAAQWYVDYVKNLHWFEAVAGSAEGAPFVLTDGTGGGYGAGTRIPYQNLKRSTAVPEATKVEVIGAGGVTATVTGTPVGGVHLVTKLVDKNIINASQATAYGQALLDELATAASYSCTIFEPGIRSGQWVHLISNRRGIDDSYIVNRVTTSFLVPDGLLQIELELGQFVPTLPELLAAVHRTVSGGSKAGPGGGGAGTGGAAPLSHGHGGGGDGSPVSAAGITMAAPAFAFDTVAQEGVATTLVRSDATIAATVSGNTATGGSHSHGLSGGIDSGGGHTHTVSGTTAAGSAHSHSVSGTTGSVTISHTHGVSGTTDPGGSDNHTHGAGTLQADLAGPGHNHGIDLPTSSESLHTHGEGSLQALSGGAHTHTDTFSVDSDGAHTHGAGTLTITGT